MDSKKYIISVKNKLIPFLSGNEIADILRDIHNDSNQNVDILKVYGKANDLAASIKMNSKKRIRYFIMVILLVISIVLTSFMIDIIPFYFYLILKSLEYSLCFMVLNQDGLLPFKDFLTKKNKFLFFLASTILLVAGIGFVIFELCLPKIVMSVNDAERVHTIITGASTAFFLLSVISLVFALFSYYKNKWLFFGGIIVQAVVCIDSIFSYNHSMKGIDDIAYAENVSIAVVLSAFFSLIYFAKRTRIPKTYLEERYKTD